MTQPKPNRKLSTEEFRKKMAEHGVERIPEEERQSGIWTLTFIAKKPAPKTSDDEDSAALG